MSRSKTSITMDDDLLAEAREYGINVSSAARDGVAAVVKAERQRRWKEENRAGIEEYNAWIEKNGLPFGNIRAFWQTGG